MNALRALRAAPGPFAEWQPQYARAGIVTLPLDMRLDSEGKPLKKWLVTRPERFGRAASAEQARRRPDAQGIGFLIERARLTIVDVDLPDEGLLAECLDHFGVTPFIVRTARGKFHAYYRNAGEAGRHQKIWGPDRPVDLLAEGLIVAAGSTCALGAYEIVQGSLDDLARLPPMNGAATVFRAVPRPANDSATRPASAANDDARGLRDGEGRNSALYHFLGPMARDHCDTFEALLDAAHAWAEDHFADPMPRSEIEKTAGSVWKLELKGKNYIGLTSQEEIILNPNIMDRIAAAGGSCAIDGLALYAAAKKARGGFETFPITYKPDDWTSCFSRDRLRAAKRVLIAAGAIRQVRGHSSTQGRAAEFGWTDTN